MHDLPPALAAVEGRTEERIFFNLKGSNEPYRRIAPVLDALQDLLDTMEK